MEPNKNDLIQAIEWLIQKLDKRVFDFRFGQDNLSPKDDSCVIGSLVTECSELGRIELPTKCLFFSINFGETLLFRGIIGFASVLYAKQNQKFRESVLSVETVDGVCTSF